MEESMVNLQVWVCICKSLCEKLSIGIEVTSEKDKWTNVDIIFPLNKKELFK